MSVSPFDDDYRERERREHAAGIAYAMAHPILTIEDIEKERRDRDYDERRPDRARYVPVPRRKSLPIPDITRQMVYARAKEGHTEMVCEECWCDRPLELHHLHYGSVGREIPEDLEALCRGCHEARHRNPITGLLQVEPIANDEDAQGFLWAMEKDD